MPRELGGGCKGQNWLNCMTRYFDRDEYRNRDVYTLIYPYTELDLNQSLTVFLNRNWRRNFKKDSFLRVVYLTYKGEIMETIVVFLL